MSKPKTSTKKTQVKKAENKDPVSPILELDVQGPVYHDGVKHFSPHDLLKYDLAQSKVQLAVQATQLKVAEIEQLKVNFERAVGILRQQMAELTVQQRQSEGALRTLQGQIEQAYDIKLNEVTYDDVSGRIRMLPKPDEAKA